MARCFECRKSGKVKVCEIHNPKGVSICKECCVYVLKGHGCKWWEMCHGA